MLESPALKGRKESKGLKESKGQLALKGQREIREIMFSIKI
jgi:hypothetical protein